ncbi:GGDEF domain-containing protein [Sneathiella sp.]|uniref:GGDEF domain-containing protein n=1 Tax=Sneathiella sp. TaxID=1964365 RepID=UPI00261974F4|nr:GGDEF domain-containing protein [Sneathiella sp.]MDF2367219.1 GGDEF domain-containing protein [Sneathiella sp.]
MKIGTGGQSRPVASGTGSKTGKTGVTGRFTSPRQIDDSASVLGIPEAELTPRVQDAIRTLMAEVDGLRERVTDLTRRVSEAEHIADQDPLLPIYNRRAFVRELTRVQASVERYQTEASLVYLDLNRFKSINDDLGHEAGDYVLSQVAIRLKESVRDTDIVGRLGGDEFGLILSRTKAEDARNLIDRLPKLFAEKPIIWKGASLNTSISSGVVSIHSGQNPEQTLSAADNEMYKEKQQASRPEA